MAPLLPSFRSRLWWHYGRPSSLGCNLTAGLPVQAVALRPSFQSRLQPCGHPSSLDCSLTAIFFRSRRQPYGHPSSLGYGGYRRIHAGMSVHICLHGHGSTACSIECSIECSMECSMAISLHVRPTFVSWGRIDKCLDMRVDRRILDWHDSQAY